MMSFKLTHPLPSRCFLAISGGVDSMAALHWLTKVKGRVQGVVHVNHGTGDFANRAEEMVRKKVQDLSIPCYATRLVESPPPGASKEEWWREERYNWFDKVSSQNPGMPIVTAHNMDDCFEELIMCSMIRGYYSTIPYNRRGRESNCIRPFRMWKRSDILEYAKKYNLEWIEDPSNRDTHFKRAHIRHKVVPLLLELNPGAYRIVEKVIRNLDSRNKQILLMDL